MKKHDVDSVVQYFGGRVTFSVIMGVGQEFIRTWQRDQEIPGNHAAWIEVLSGGKYLAADLPTRGEVPEIKRGAMTDRAADIEREARRLFDVIDNLRKKIGQAISVA
jgi:hypothetical protein